MNKAQISLLSKENGILRRENDRLYRWLFLIRNKSNRRHRELRRLNNRMADLSTAKQLEDKLGRFIRDMLDRYGVSDNGDKENSLTISERHLIAKKHEEAEGIYKELTTGKSKFRFTPGDEKKGIVEYEKVGESGVTEEQPIATGITPLPTNKEPEIDDYQFVDITVRECEEAGKRAKAKEVVDRGRAMWQNPVDVTRPAAHVKHTDGVCETCGYNPCRCSDEF